MEAAERILAFPNAGRMVPEYMEPAIRETIHSPYRIIYRLKPDLVEILTVIHGRRSLDEEVP